MTLTITPRDWFFILGVIVLIAGSTGPFSRREVSAVGIVLILVFWLDLKGVLRLPL